jgi:hypothetical protein
MATAQNIAVLSEKYIERDSAVKEQGPHKDDYDDDDVSNNN